MDFYKKATTDFMIGYHFRKIQESATSASDDPLYPALKQFAKHIPRIIDFWCLQLGVQSPNEKSDQFQLLKLHKDLNVRMGEINRWLILFRETIQEKENLVQDKEIIKALEEKVTHFEKIMKRELFI